MERTPINNHMGFYYGTLILFYPKSIYREDTHTSLFFYANTTAPEYKQ